MNDHQDDDRRRRADVDLSFASAVADLRILELQANAGVRDEDEDRATPCRKREITRFDRALGAEREEREERVGECERGNSGAERNVEGDGLGLGRRPPAIAQPKGDGHQGSKEDARRREPAAPESKTHRSRYTIAT